MSIPLATTRITVYRVDVDRTADAFDRPAPTVVYAGVPAVIGGHSGTETTIGGSSQLRQARLDCDPIRLAHDDTIVDEQTGETWHVIWCAQRFGVGLDHTVADLVAVTDRAAV